jgi:hypothetical protein
VTIPDSVTDIGYGAFSFCRSLELSWLGAPTEAARALAASLSSGATIVVAAGQGWEEVLDADGRYNGIKVVIQGPPLEEITSSAFDGGTSDIALTAEGGWTISNLPDWLALSATTGKDSANLVATFAENPGKDARSATITVTLESGFRYGIAVTQAGQPLRTITLKGAKGSTSAIKGAQVTLTAVAPQGEASKLFAYRWEASGKAKLEVSGTGNSQAVLTMPGKNVTVTAYPRRKVSLAKGWNLLALSHAIGANGAAALDAYRLFALRGNAYGRVGASELQAGEGFWLYSSKATSIYLEYDLGSSSEIDIPSGRTALVGLPDTSANTLAPEQPALLYGWSGQSLWSPVQSVGGMFNLSPFQGYLMVPAKP